MTKQFIFLFLLAVFCQAQTWNQVGNSITGPTGEYASYSSINSVGDIIAIGSPYNDQGGTDSGRVNVMQFDGTDWVQLGQTIYGEEANEQSGLAVSLSGDGYTLAIGARYNSVNGSHSGQVRVFKYDEATETWNQLGNYLNGAASNWYGYSVSLNEAGTRLVVGAGLAANQGAGSGYVEVYDLDGTTWIKVGQTIYNNTIFNSFGYDVDINEVGNIIAVTPLYGTVKTFQLDGTIWVETGSFAGTYSRVDLNAAGDRLALGDFNANQGGFFSGKAEVFQREGAEWTQLGQGIFGTGMMHSVGNDVSLSADGDILAIGSQLYSSGAGRFMVYKIVDGAWTQLGEDILGSTGDNFGFILNINATGNRVVAGSLNAGNVKAYDYSCTLEFPGLPIVEAICAGNSTQLTIDSEDSNVNWYTTADAETPTFTGLTFETPELTETTSYWVELFNELGCFSERVEIVINVNPLPVLEAETTYEICSGNEASLYANSPSNVIFWYANEDDTEYLYHGNLFVTEELTENTTFWVEAYNLITGCTSERIEVTISVSEAISAPTAQPTQEFQEGLTLADLEVEHTGTLTWYADAQLTQELPETTLVVVGTTYYVTQSSGACQSGAIAILVDNFLGNGNLSNDKFAYYPNPVKDVLNFSGKEVVRSVQIYDLSGKLILNQNSNSILNINLSSLPKGTYVVRAATTEKQVNIFQIVKN